MNRPLIEIEITFIIDQLPLRSLTTEAYLVVLVGKAEPLVERDGTVAVVVDRLELVGRASLIIEQHDDCVHYGDQGYYDDHNDNDDDDDYEDDQKD